MPSRPEEFGMYRLKHMQEDTLDRAMTWLYVAFMALAGLLAWGITTVVKADESLAVAVDPAEGVFNAVASGDWLLAAALALSMGIYGLRTWALPSLPEGKFKSFVLSDAGGVVVTLLGAIFGGFASAIATGVPFGAAWFVASFKVALASMGGYAGFKKLLFGKPAEKPVVGERI